ncbi:LLM class flavin-dependent oxidoreductase [Roseomonas sp. SSH11]|uniref:LLM class flavin-dependent oxidoreductase n=1 Tax=Pararoseomonas baculiformis TaxID=2820812 RepID=A0ABS4AL57_9PROT|nr:LLM class flavin-dependent oxidoreductase [Pararoseomonas baculiformis]MBP0447250.1 LLM class flavin-dependent oxidoreductase [Pararoseomonas baculiformis]
MDIALFNLMSQNRADESPAEILGMTVEKVRLAEALGFDGAWFAEHHFTSHSVCPSPLMMVAHCAAATSRIWLGPAVVVMPLHHPLRVVQELGMLQALSGGRVRLGLGTGHQPHEFRTYGISMSERTAILEEGWDIIEKGLTTGRVGYQGRHFQVPDAPIAAFPGTMPPLFLAGGEPQLLQRTARAGGSLFISQGHRRASAARPMREKLLAALRAGGLPETALRLAIQRYVFVTDDESERRQAAEGMLRFIRTTLSLRGEEPARDGTFMRSIPFEGEPSIEWLLENAPIGSAQLVADRLAEDFHILQPSHWSLYMGFSGLPAPRVLAALERFGEKVLPTLRRLSPEPVRLAS